MDCGYVASLGCCTCCCFCFLLFQSVSTVLAICLRRPLLYCCHSLLAASSRPSDVWHFWLGHVSSLLLLVVPSSLLVAVESSVSLQVNASLDGQTLMLLIFLFSVTDVFRQTN